MKRAAQVLALAVAPWCLSGCAGAGPLVVMGIQALPSLFAVLKPILAKATDRPSAVAKAQTALDLLQTVNTGEFPSETAVNMAIAQAGRRCLTDAEYVAIRDALTPAFQKLVQEAQAQPGGLVAVQARVSNAIVATQEKLSESP